MPLTSQIQFQAASAPITEPVTKFGGQPVWHDAPQWPLSRTTGNPMRFICQVALDPRLFPDAIGKMAYVFMTDEDEYVDGTWEPDGGENAVIIQPAPLAAGVRTSPQATGPTLFDMVQMPGYERLAPLEREYAVAMRLAEEPPFQPQALGGNKLGGSPVFLQGDEFPDEGEWRLLLQLDSADVPFSVNFGDAGVAYAFIDPTGQAAKMLWQCC